MAGLFISYRRADHPELLRGLYNRLVAEYPSARVFRDIDNLVGGLPFPDQLRDALAASSLVLVIIGPAWATITDQTGQRRLDDPHDYLRRELEQALASPVRVVPVLIANAGMPRTEDIPTSLHPLLLLHALPLRLDRFEKDVMRLLKHIDPDMRQRPSMPLFNGKDLTNWYLAGPHTTTIATGDGVLRGENTTHQEGYVDHLVTRRTDFANFNLQYEFLVEKADAPVGVQVRVDASQVTFGGMRGYLIAAGGSGYTVQHQHMEYQGHLWDPGITTLALASRARPGFGLVEASHQPLALGAWHRVEIRATDNRLRVWLNRRLDVSGLRATREGPLIDFPEDGRAFHRGAIALVFYPGACVRYRNIKIRSVRDGAADEPHSSRVRWIHRQMVGNEWNERWQVFQCSARSEWIESVTDPKGFWQHLFSEVDRTDEYIELQREYGPNKRVVVRLFADHAASGATRDQLTEQREGQWVRS
jgi:Domain of Unknown Function (DUF1080)/TIR domain